MGWGNANYQRILFHSVRTASAERLREMTAPRRHLALVCFLHQAWRATLDQAVDMYGRRATFDEIIANGLKRRRPVQHIIGELLKAEIAEKKARSIKYQMTIVKLAMAKELAHFDFSATPVNEPLVREFCARRTSLSW